MKIKALLLSTFMVASLLVGCGAKEPAQDESANKEPKTEQNEQAKEEPKTDAVASASITDDPEVFAKSLGKDGRWIIAVTADLALDKELVLEGEFTNGKKDDEGNEIIQRKIALYTQDDNRNVTERFTLTAPKLTIKSPAASIQHGIFKGDLYVETDDFKLVDTKVEGNIYFKDDAAMAGFTMDEESSVSGKQEVQK